jgi:hypothetical protein
VRQPSRRPSSRSVMVEERGLATDRTQRIESCDRRIVLRSELPESFGAEQPETISPLLKVVDDPLRRQPAFVDLINRADREIPTRAAK